MKKICFSLVVFSLLLLLFASCGEDVATTSADTVADTRPVETVITTASIGTTASTTPDTTVETVPVTTADTASKTETTAAPPETSKTPSSETAPQSTAKPSVPTVEEPLCLNEIDKMMTKAIAFEKTTLFNKNIFLTYVFNDNATDIDSKMLSGMQNQTVYAAVRVDDQLFRINDYSTSGVYLYCNVEQAGAMLIAGVTYSVALEFYNSNGDLLYYSRNELLASTVNTVKTPEREALTVTLPQTGLNKISVKASTLSASSIEVDKTSNLSFLFDGNSSVNKFVGTVQDRIPTVYFSLNKAETLTHYTLRTASDTSSYPERNPAGWRLYGKVGDMWMLLSRIESTPTHETGLKATDLGSFSYAISSPIECLDYKLEFTFASDVMQLGDIELYATEGFSVAAPDPNAGTLLSGIAGVQIALSDFRLIPELQNHVGVAYYFASQDSLAATVRQKLISGEMFATITLDDTTYQIQSLTTSGNYLILDLQASGAPVFANILYNVTLAIYEASGARLYYTVAEPRSSAYQTPNLPQRVGENIELPENITQVKVNTNSVQTENIVHWGDGAPGQLFDGNTTSTKIGGAVPESGEFTLTFKLNSPTTLTYYTFYTGNDTVTHPDRNPLGWQLYGKVGNEYVLLSDVRENAVTYHGMDTVNATPYSYKIENPQNCSEYMIVFYTDSMFQLNEMILYKNK